MQFRHTHVFFFFVVAKEGLRVGQLQAGEGFFASLLLVAVCTPHLFGLRRRRIQRCKCMFFCIISLVDIDCHIDLTFYLE